MLYDMFGNRVDTTRLKQAEAAPTVTGVRSILSGHPAQGLTPERLAALLRGAEDGDPTSFLELAEEMEEKDLHYRSVISTRKLQVGGLPVTVEAASDEATDVKAADLVRDWLDSGVLSGAMLDLLDAVGKGFSVCEIMWDTEGRVWTPTSILWRDPRWFRFDRIGGQTLLLRGDDGQEQPLSPYKYIGHVHKSKSGLPVRGGLARAAAWSYLFKMFDLKSWVQFAEVYGFPLRIGKHANNATEEEKLLLLRAVRDIGQDAAAIIPDGMKIEFTPGASRSDSGLFQGMADYFDRQISKLVLGQTGTTDVGQHVGTANAHEKVREDIEQADATQLAATLQRDLVRPLVDLNLGPRKRYPSLIIARPDTEDVTALIDNALKIANVSPEGFVEVSVLRDKLGLPEPAAGAVCLGGSRPEQPEQLGKGDTEEQPAAMVKAWQRAGVDWAATEGCQPRSASAAIAAPIASESEFRTGRVDERNMVDTRDYIDDLVDSELEGWERVITPMVSPIQRLAAECVDEQEFLDRLPEILSEQDVTALARSLAESAFAARVLAETGDGHGNA